MAEAVALTATDFAGHLSAVIATEASGLVLAVSGGPDSMALMALAAQARSAFPPIVAASVDHRLRPDSEADVALVARAAERLGLPFRALVWTGPKPTNALQERARNARYRLLAGLAREVGADHLVTAHTLDDQAETVLFRLMRGSGLAGLAGMARVGRRGEFVLARPLLGIAKARLVATCRILDIPFVQDPANADPRFARARMRSLLPRLAEEGLDALALARLARRADRAETALRAMADEAFADCVRSPGVLNGRRVAALPPEIALRVIGRAIHEGGGAAARLDRLERLAARIATAAAAGTGLRATLGGAVITLAADGALTVAPEGARRRGSASSFKSNSVVGFPWQA